MVNDIPGKQQEHFVCISLDGSNELIEKWIEAVGLLSKTQVHPREVAGHVITGRAAAEIFAHNHPSGELRPSNGDLALQKQLVEAARILGIIIPGHLIVSKKG